MRRYTIASIVVLLMFGLMVSGPVNAMEVSHYHGHKGEYDLEKLKNRAKEFGIETEGKDAETIAKEVRRIWMEKKAEKLGISTDGKDIKQLTREVHETWILKKADELGIESEGKSIEKLKKEVKKELKKN